MAVRSKCRPHQIGMPAGLAVCTGCISQLVRLASRLYLLPATRRGPCRPEWSQISLAGTVARWRQAGLFTAAATNQVRQASQESACIVSHWCRLRRRSHQAAVDVAVHLCPLTLRASNKLAPCSCLGRTSNKCNYDTIVGRSGAGLTLSEEQCRTMHSIV
eukprot:COSAG06_NODE_900_length_11658_cov_9.850852_5_plen_160_part_00